jgi:hypothetical protein
MKKKRVAGMLIAFNGFKSKQMEFKMRSIIWDKNKTL